MCRCPLRIGAALISKCGDWAWMKAVLGLRGWRGEGPNKGTCWLCAAGFNETHNCYDFSLKAAWRDARTTMPSFWEDASFRAQYVSGIWSIPGFHLATIKLDWMHVCCLGILQYLLGNVLWECFRELGGSMTNSRTACSKLLNILKMCSDVCPP